MKVFIQKEANKIKLVLALFFTLFFLTSQISFAQNNNILFDVTKEIRQEKITPSTNNLAVSLLPFTTITIKPGTFKEEVTLYVYQGDFDKIKAVLPQGQSPISAYLLVFRTPRGAVSPLFPITIESYNNYTNTNTFFYPLLSSFAIDKTNQKNWPGNIKVRTDLPVQDVGFIVAANKNLQANDSSLLNSFPAATAKPQQVKAKENALPFNTSSTLQVAGLLLIVIIAIIAVYWRMIKGRKK